MKIQILHCNKCCDMMLENRDKLYVDENVKVQEWTSSNIWGLYGGMNELHPSV